MNKNWLELIEKKYDEIINVGEKAYKDALENQHLRFIVEMDENGNVYSWYDVAGGNSFHASTYNGESIELFEFCMQYWENNPADETVEEKLREKGLYDLYLKERESFRMLKIMTLQSLFFQIRQTSSFRNVLKSAGKTSLNLWRMNTLDLKA